MAKHPETTAPDGASAANDSQGDAPTTSTASGVEAPEQLASESPENRFFDTSHLASDLKGRAVRGGAITMVGQFASKAIQIGSTIVLARILTPRDYGLVAMITVVTGFVTLFKDLGLSMATVQREQVTHEQVSTLFWINLALSTLVMLIVMALAPAIAWFYDEPQLFWLTVVMAGSFVFSGLTVQHQALLRRQMRFGALAGLEITRLVVSVAVGIAAALAGAGVWALIYMTLSGAIFISIAVWIICPWRPSRPRRGTGVRGMLAFGGHLTGSNVISYFARNLDNLLIGKVWGSGQLGLYSKAYGLLLLPLQQITAPVAAVAIPTLSRLHNDPERYRRYYLKAVSLIAAVTMPGVLYMVLMSHEIIRVILGDQWTGAAKIFAILGVSALIQPVANTSGWLYISSGRTDRMLKWGVVAGPIIVCSFFIGLPFGAIGVAASYTGCTLLLAAPGLWYASKRTPVAISAIAGAIWQVALATAIAGMALAAFIYWLPQLAMGVRGLVLGLTVISVTYLSSSIALARGMPPVFDVVGFYRGTR